MTRVTGTKHRLPAIASAEAGPAITPVVVRCSYRSVRDGSQDDQAPDGLVGSATAAAAAARAVTP